MKYRIVVNCGRDGYFTQFVNENTVAEFSIYEAEGKVFDTPEGAWEVACRVLNGPWSKHLKDQLYSLGIQAVAP